MFEPMLKQGEDYSFFSVNEIDAGFKINSGIFEDVSFMVGNLSLEETGEECHLVFNYEVVDSASFDKEALSKDDDFKNHIGDILTSVIAKNLEENRSLNEFGIVDIAESDLQ